MGRRLWWSVFVPFWVYFFVIAPVSAATLCDVQGCNCTRRAASWQSINCSLNNAQVLELEHHDIPYEAVEIFIVGGEKIIFNEKAFSFLTGLILLHIQGTKQLAFKRQSFHNITSPSLLIRVQSCDHLNITTGSFDVQSSIQIEIERCGTVILEKSAFSKLQSALFQDISKLVLTTESFEFKNSGNLGKHGPVTKITLDKVLLPTIPHKTFFSTLAGITITNCEIQEIHHEAFSANSISEISITNSKIGVFQSDAFYSGTQILNFKISNCTISKIESRAFMAAIDNLTVQHSSITDIQSGAINGTLAKVEIIANEIGTIYSMGLVINNWNKIAIEQNIIKSLHANFLVAPINSEVVELSFNGNDIFHLEKGALSFVPNMEEGVFVFKNNFFNQTCHCSIDEWIAELITANVTTKIKQIVDNAFCTINDLLWQCFELPMGVINIQNFTELVCNDNNTIICEPYRGEIKIVNTTSKMLSDNYPPVNTNWLTLIISCTAVLLVIVVASFILMLIRGSRWLKRKGYLRKIQYNQNEQSNDEENTIETVDENERLDISEDLTMDLLQNLSIRLDDPNTHQEASEMIEQLYQKYIRNSGENNNHQDDEAHLYEELGNLQAREPEQDILQNGPRSILRMMEERFNTQIEDIDADEEQPRPALAGEYSEPSDAAVHYYSELKNRELETSNNDSLKSRTSSNMALRPLPDKPGSSKM